jgi:hypothetical protein
MNQLMSLQLPWFDDSLIVPGGDVVVSIHLLQAS